MEVKIKGKGAITLHKNDFVASGGEGSVYRKGDRAFKIYTDSAKMIPLAKISELSALTLPNIVKPEEVLYDNKNVAVGYTMAFLDDAHPLCRIFTKAFRDRMNIKPDQIIHLVKKFQTVVSHIHSKDILIVDCNEMNFMLDSAFDEIYAIDCDSYNTKHFPTHVIMDSIRDRHATGTNNQYSPTKGTDWFSFGILTFQMFIGIHPFKGRHPNISNMDDRMKKNVSVLNKDVGIPAVCYPFSNIPKTYLEWYKAIFDEGKRVPPPNEVQAVILVPRAIKITGSNKFTISKILELNEDIVRVDYGAHVAITAKGVYSLSSGQLLYDISNLPLGSDPAIGTTPSGKLVAAHVLRGGKIRLFDIAAGKDLPDTFAGTAMTSHDGAIYVKNLDSIHEIQFVEPGNSIRAASKVVAQTMPNSTSMHDGCAIQDVLGACYISIFPQSKRCHQIHLKELDGTRIIDAKYDGNIVMVIAYRNGKYDRIVFLFEDDFKSYKMHQVSDVGPVGLNFVVTPKGVCANLNENEEIELFRNKPPLKINIYDDPALSGDMKLAKHGTQVLFARANVLYSIELKKI